MASRTLTRAKRRRVSGAAAALLLLAGHPGCAEIVGVERLSGDGPPEGAGASGTGGTGGTGGSGGEPSGGGGAGGAGGGGAPGCPDQNGCIADETAASGDAVTLDVVYETSISPPCVRLIPFGDPYVTVTFTLDMADDWANHRIVGGLSDGASMLEKDPTSPITGAFMSPQGDSQSVSLTASRCSYPYYCELHPQERGVIYVDPQMP